MLVTFSLHYNRNGWVVHSFYENCKLLSYRTTVHLICRFETFNFNFGLSTTSGRMELLCHLWISVQLVDV